MTKKIELPSVWPGLMEPTEDQEQAKVIEWCDTVGVSLWPSLVVDGRFMILAIPNGGARTAVTGARMRRTGTRAGVPDLFLPVPVGRHITGHAGLWIELKRSSGGRVAPRQRTWLDALEARGYVVRVCHGASAAIEEIKWYLKGWPDGRA